MLTILFWGSLSVVILIVVQKWIRLRKGASWLSSEEMHSIPAFDVTLVPIIRFVHKHVYTDRVKERCYSAARSVSLSARQVKVVAGGHAKKVHNSFNDLVQGKHDLRHTGPASFFLKSISEHKNNKRKQR